MRIRSRRPFLNHHPFTGDGVSLYAQVGTSLQYSNRRVYSRCLKGTGGEFGIGSTSVTKTSRVASVASPATTIDYTFPVSWHSQTVTVNLRTYKDDVENEDISGSRTFVLDGSGVVVSDITGTAVLLSTRKMDGGVVEIRFQWYEGDGLPAATFQLIRTAGPTSPSNIVFDASGSGVYAVETSVLSDASAYTFKIRAVNGSVTKDVLTGISVTADATGPSAPTSGSAKTW